MASDTTTRICAPEGGCVFRNAHRQPPPAGQHTSHAPGILAGGPPRGRVGSFFSACNRACRRRFEDKGEVGASAENRSERALYAGRVLTAADETAPATPGPSDDRIRSGVRR